MHEAPFSKKDYIVGESEQTIFYLYEGITKEQK